MKRTALLITATCVFVSGCTSIKSTYLVTDSKRSKGGLVYFMPNKDLLVSFKVVDRAMAGYVAEYNYLNSKRSDLVAMRTTVADSNYVKPIDAEIARIDIALIALTRPATASFASQVAEITVSDTYPDTSQSYSLHAGLNHFGKNTIDVSISERGLLSTAKSKTESQVSEAFTNLASSVGRVGTGRHKIAAATSVTESCPVSGTYQFRLNFKKDFTWTAKPDSNGKPTSTFIAKKKIKCAGTVYDLDLEKLWDKSLRNGPDCGNKAKDCKNAAGLFYRQPLPYLARVSSGSESRLVTTVYSTSEAPNNMLPIKGSFFADAETNFAFNEGVPTKFTEVSDGEIVSLLKLPADIISAYFGAVGATFNSFKDTDSAEIDSLKTSLTLQLAKEKNQKCAVAISAGDEAQIESLKCAE